MSGKNLWSWRGGGRGEEQASSAGDSEWKLAEAAQSGINRFVGGRDGEEPPAGLLREAGVQEDRDLLRVVQTKLKREGAETGNMD